MTDNVHGNAYALNRNERLEITGPLKCLITGVCHDTRTLPLIYEREGEYLTRGDEEELRGYRMLRCGMCCGSGVERCMFGCYCGRVWGQTVLWESVWQGVRATGM